jgi:hypothetical protein
MIDYLKANHLSLLIVGYLVFSSLMGGAPAAEPLGAGDRTTVSNPWTFEDNVTLSADATFSGGDGAIVVTSSNTATSSIEVGCIQMYATSTATAGKLTLQSGTDAASTTGPTGLHFMPVWTYGNCP